MVILLWAPYLTGALSHSIKWYEAQLRSFSFHAFIYNVIKCLLSSYSPSMLSSHHTAEVPPTQVPRVQGSYNLPYCAPCQPLRGTYVASGAAETSMAGHGPSHGDF